jgi:drug/metabolite transporter (DMT)-like permease
LAEVTQRPLRTAALTAATLLCFAANSLLCRAALGPGTIDAASFTGIRLLSGAVVLAVIVRAAGGRGHGLEHGSWQSAGALFAYAVAFSFAYLRIGAGVGALVLFGAVQATMLGWAMATGERPRLAEWLGLALALGGLAALTLPGAHAPDPIGLALMAAAGVFWGIYSLRGRGAPRPLAATAANFALSLPMGLVLVALVLITTGHGHVSQRGALLAVASGALASGVGYSIWYAALRGLTATRAAIVQLAVPVIAAGAAIGLLGETLSPRLVGSGCAILVGVGIALVGRR